MQLSHQDSIQPLPWQSPKSIQFVASCQHLDLIHTDVTWTSFSHASPETSRPPPRSTQRGMPLRLIRLVVKNKLDTSSMPGWIVQSSLFPGFVQGASQHAFKALVTSSQQHDVVHGDGLPAGVPEGDVRKREACIEGVARGTNLAKFSRSRDTFSEALSV